MPRLRREERFAFLAAFGNRNKIMSADRPPPSECTLRSKVFLVPTQIRIACSFAKRCLRKDQAGVVAYLHTGGSVYPRLPICFGGSHGCYDGISRTAVQRLRQHVTGNTHFDASLAYLMATDKTGHKMKRSDAMQDPAFRTAFNQVKALLRDCSVAFIDIDNPLELYRLEAYCAMELDTCEWNTFRTH